MAKLTAASPKFSVYLYKTISRGTVDGQTGVSTRYQGKSDFIDLTEYLGLGSSIRTSKSIREPAGGFMLTFADKAQTTDMVAGKIYSIESIYGLIEPMDVIEIRMWGGTGTRSKIQYPIVMRGFVSNVQRQQAMGGDGKPMRQVIVSGMDYGKIWQQYIILYLSAYTEKTPLLTGYNLWEMFGIKAWNTISASEFVKTMIKKVINPHLAGFLPKENAGIIHEIQTIDADILVKHGKIGNSPQGEQGSIYEMLKKHGDVGIWNELYIEDRYDGVHCVYRPVPARSITGDGDRLIQDDAVMPPVVTVPDDIIVSIQNGRTDANVANFYWVDGAKYDLIDDMTRRLMSIPTDDKLASKRDYPNAASKYYGTRPMYGSTMQSDDDIKYDGSGMDAGDQERRGKKQLSWTMNRLKIMGDMNKDNVVLESGQCRIKGGLMRSGNSWELMKAGDYARFKIGNFPEFDAYVVQVDHEFSPFDSYTQTLTFERSEGFVTRVQQGYGKTSPYLTEQGTRLE